MKQKNSGITLIALVVTIIILLLLAGISVSMLTGENGILNRAVEAAEETEKASNIEQEAVDNMSGLLTDYVEGYDEDKGCNSPKLTSGMVPVNYNESTEEWEECSTDDWEWDYIAQDSTTESGGTSKWANAMTEDGSLWVWIPRYAYKITSGYHTSTAGTIEVVFLVGSTNEDGDGNTYGATYDIDTATTNGAMSSYVVHPAFGSNTTQGGWDSDIPGFWVAKFEAGFAGTPGDSDSAQDSTVVYTSNLYYDLETAQDSIYGTITPNETLMKYPTFTAGVYSYCYISVGDAYGLASSLNSSENPYGFTSNCNTHMMKNSEWGAVAYLTQSSYGRNGTEISINNWGPMASTGAFVSASGSSGFIAHTGYSAGDETSAERNKGDVTTTNYYNTAEGVLASTTGNVYGVYDLSGGVAEYVSSYAEDLDAAAYSSYKSTAEYYAEYGSYLLSDTKNKLKNILTTDSNYLSDTTSTGRRANYATHKYIFGDAMWEICENGSLNDGWNGDGCWYPGGVRPFLSRGGLFSIGTFAGTFYFGYNLRLPE